MSYKQLMLIPLFLLLNSHDGSEAASLMRLSGPDQDNGSTALYGLSALADDGTIVGSGSSAYEQSPLYHSWKWTLGEGFTSLTGPHDNRLFVSGTSTNGVVIGGSPAFRWITGHEYLPDPPRDPSGLSRRFWRPSGVSADGSVVVGMGDNADYWDRGSREGAVRWTEETGTIDLGVLPGRFESLATAVSDDGRVTVGYSNRIPESGGLRVLEGFRWTEETGMVVLGEDNIHNTPEDISADGSVIVGHWKSPERGREPFRWTSETGIVGIPSSPRGVASAVSADGSIVIGSNAHHAVLPGFAFIWDETHGTRNLFDVYDVDVTDWEAMMPYDMSSNGKIMIGMGKYLPHNGNQQGWILTIPEPSSIAMMTTSLVILACAWKRRKRRTSK